EKTDWLPGTIISSGLIVCAWAYFIYTGSISTIWPMFGISNQLLAAVALCVATTILINSGKARYVWVTLLPLSFVATTTLTAAWQSLTDNFYPLTQSGEPDKVFQGWLNIALTAAIMSMAIAIIILSAKKWLQGKSAHRIGSAKGTLDLPDIPA